MDSKRKRLNKKQRKMVYDKTNGYCAYCGCELQLNNFHCDHIKSIRKHAYTPDGISRVKNDDIDTIENMFPACRSCNLYKSTLDLEEFRQELSKIPSRLQRDESTYNIAKRYGLIVENNKEIEFYFEMLLSVGVDTVD